LPALVSKNSDDYEILQESVDHRILMKFSRNLIRILEFDPYSNQKIRWPLNSSNISIQFRWQLNSSRVRWSWLDDHGTLMKFLKGFWSEFLSRIRWPQNSCEIFQGFRSEFWWPAFVYNNSDDYEILQELDDHRILTKFSSNLIRIL
jgi:hypothetical protein